MKNFKYLIFATVILLTASNCRKGKDDPFFSLMTRKARLTNEWILIEGNQTEVNTFEGDTLIFEYTITEDSISYFDGYENQTIAYSETIVFNKDDTYKLVKELDHNEYGIIKITYNGNWNFMNSESDYKNKERVSLTIDTKITEISGQSTTTTYNDADVTFILYLTKLSKNELNFDFDLTIQDSTTYYEINGTKKFVEK